MKYVLESPQMCECVYECVCGGGLYLDGDASVDTGHVNAMWLPVGQVTLVHIYSEWPLQTSQVIPHL